MIRATPFVLALAGGFASPLPAAAAPEVSVAYVIDASGSTSSFGGSCGDQNADGSSDTILDCEIAGVLTLNRAVVPYAPVSGGVVGFGGDAVAADVGPATGTQSLTNVAADGDDEGTRDIEQVAGSLTQTGFGLFTTAPIAEGTDFDAALDELNTLSALTAAKMQAAFLSDGADSFSTGPGSPLQNTADSGTEVDAFAIGTGSAGCGPASALRTVADSTGGSCVEVSDPAQLTGGLAWFPPPCSGQPATVLGTSDGDTLPGTGDADVIAALGGADKVIADAGNDFACGGPGRDTLKGGPGKDTLIGGLGNDVCRGGPGRDQLKSC